MYTIYLYNFIVFLSFHFFSECPKTSPTKGEIDEKLLKQFKQKIAMLNKLKENLSKKLQHVE